MAEQVDVIEKLKVSLGVRPENQAIDGASLAVARELADFPLMKSQYDKISLAREKALAIKALSVEKIKQMERDPDHPLYQADRLLEGIEKDLRRYRKNFGINVEKVPQYHALKGLKNQMKDKREKAVLAGCEKLAEGLGMPWETVVALDDYEYQCRDGNAQATLPDIDFDTYQLLTPYTLRKEQK